MGILKQKIWTYNDYFNLDDDKRYEVIEGELIEIPAPSTLHQEILLNLASELLNFVKTSENGKIYIAPCDVIFSDIITLQPDIIFISTEKLNIIEPKGVFGTPDLVVEILSPSDADLDRARKFQIYEKFQVKEHWIIDTESESVEVFTLIENRFLSLCNKKKSEKIQSNIFTDVNLCYNNLLS